MGLTRGVLKRPVTTVLAILMIGNGFDEKVRKTELKIFGHISDVNKTAKGDLIL